jgi:hypothetical protein
MTSQPSIYPIKAKIVGDSEVAIEILQISHTGMLVDSLVTPLVVGKSYQIRFEFPLIDEGAEVTVVALRTYAEMNPAGAPRKARHMNEFVYKKPPRTFNELLIKFLAVATHRQKT